MTKNSVDKPFLWLALALVVAGIFIFLSASLGLLAREGIRLSAIVANQALGLGLGLAAMWLASRVPFRAWNKYALPLFIVSVAATLLVFVPGIGFSHGGATRWLSIAGFSVQPSEFLKLGFVLYFASWLASVQRGIGDIKKTILPFAGLLAIVGGILAFQPDVDTFLVVALTGLGMLVAAGAKWRHTVSFAALAGGALVVLGFFVPYIRARLLTFLNPAGDPLGAGYQIQQSLIAVGSGGVFGRGFGQSVQKFSFLPEPVSDSIFAVFAEEWGLSGALALIALFTLFALRGFKIASRAPTMASGLLVAGIIVMMMSQIALNIAAMLGLFPLSGMPLLFVSQGGTALLTTLLEVGIVLGISRSMTKERAV